MNYKMPYYLANPIPELWDEEKMCKRDREYMRGIYPEVAKMLLPFIERECQRLEYDGSLIYDEYPDKILLRFMCNRIYNHAEDELYKQGMILDSEKKLWIRELLEVLVYQALCEKRASWRTKKRKWY